MEQATTTLFISTRKAAFMMSRQLDQAEWSFRGPIHLGAIVGHFTVDSRNGQTLLLGARTSHLGPSVFVSDDFGQTWQESQKPPAFEAGFSKSHNIAVKDIYCIQPGHPSQPQVWYLGTSPAGLFKSNDNGRTWQGVDGFNLHPQRIAWSGPREVQPPGGGGLHSIQIDPMDARHIYVAVSAGGVFETTDGGDRWKAINRGVNADFLPNPDTEFGHDPHSVKLHPLQPYILYQQNRMGIYRMDRHKGDVWENIGCNMPKEIGDYGFPIVLHPLDPQQAWVFPMDSTDAWPRVSPHGKPAAYHTADGGKTWERQDQGFPKANAFFTVKRQAMTHDGSQSLGLYVGTTGGEIWASPDAGKNWQQIAAHLPEILAIEALTWPK